MCGIGKEGVCLHSRSRQGECWYRTEWGKDIYLTPQLCWGGGGGGEGEESWEYIERGGGIE